MLHSLNNTDNLIKALSSLGIGGRVVIASLEGKRGLRLSWQFDIMSRIT